jgi:FAD/FMN-containing dehydrogenase
MQKCALRAREERGAGAGPFTVGISYRAMDRIEEISDSDMLAVAGGGVTLGRLQRAAREKGLYFPFEPESPRGDPALAELIQDGTISKYEGRYGRLRESILSIEGVTGAGETFHTGSRSVKDVTGYELAGLLTGSGGRLAMITSATLRLLRLPGTMASFAVKGEPSALRSLTGELARRLTPASMELYMESEPEALLVVAVHENGAGREKEIEASIGETIGGRPFKLSICRSNAPGAETAGPKVDGGDGEDMEAARRETLVPGEIHIAADIRAEAAGTRPRRALRESFFPHRAHWRLPKGDFEPGGYFSDPRSRERFIAALAPGFRIRAEEIIDAAGGPAARRIWPSIEGGPVSAFLAGLESAGALEAIRERLRDVFDPERILSN